MLIFIRRLIYLNYSEVEFSNPQTELEHVPEIDSEPGLQSEAEGTQLEITSESETTSESDADEELESEIITGCYPEFEAYESDSENDYDFDNLYDDYMDNLSGYEDLNSSFDDFAPCPCC